MIVVIFGPPGAGKDTIGLRLAKELSVPHIAPGDIYRDHIKRKTELGKKVLAIQGGNFAPNELTEQVIRDRLSQDDTNNGFVLNGYPRNLEQTVHWHQIIDDMELNIIKNILLTIPNSLVFERIASRAKIEGRADDADPTIVEKRLSIYREVTEPVIMYYQKKENLTVLNGIGSPDEVYNTVISKLEY